MSQNNARSAEKSLFARIAACAAALVLALTIAACGGAPVTSGGDNAADTGREQQATIEVTVEIDATAGEGEKTTAEVELPEGATGAPRPTTRSLPPPTTSTLRTPSTACTSRASTAWPVVTLAT